jgi:O-antigen/teichoic acid export membrane protein
MSSKAKMLAKGSFLRTFYFGVSILTAFFLMPFIVHSLGDTTYGLWSVIGSLMGFYGLFDFGLSSAVERYLSRAIGKRDKNEVNVVVSNALFIFFCVAICTLIVTALIVVLAPFYFSTTKDMVLFRKVVCILGISLALGFPVRVFLGVLSANLRFDMSTRANIVKLLLRSILIVIFLNYGHGILALALITFGTELFWYVSICLSVKKIAPDLQFSKKLIKRDKVKDFFNYSFLTFIAQIADKLRFNIDDFVIAAFMGLRFVTVYAIASRLISYFIQFIIQSLGIFRPVFSQYEGKGDYVAIREKFIFTTKLCGYLSCLIGSLIIIVGKPFIKVWMGKEYIAAYPILVVLVVSITVALMQSTSLQVLYGISKHGFFAISNSIEGVLNLILSLLLVKRFGLMGVALGTAIPMLLVKLFIQPFYTTRAIGMSIKKYYFDIMIPITIKSITLAIIFWKLVSSFIYPNYINLFFIVSSFVLIYSVFVFFLGLNKSDREVILGTIFNS